LESLYAELQLLSSTPLSLLAVSLNKPANHFAHYLKDSLSTLRLLHYPPQQSASAKSTDKEPKLCCTPHAKGHRMPAPHVPGTIVVKIGDLIAQVSGREFVATKHRVRTNSGGSSGADGMGRFSVSFFFEPGEACVVQSIERDESVVYGEYVRKKKGTWVEYQDDDYGESTLKQTGDGVPVEAY
jgi:isopenicillin N synthase-like dioxygenase